MLLGKESRHDAPALSSIGSKTHNRTRRGAFVWSDFGGFKNGDETDSRLTASREASEETRGIFGDGDVSRSTRLFALQLQNAPPTAFNNPAWVEGVEKAALDPQNEFLPMKLVSGEGAELSGVGWRGTRPGASQYSCWIAPVPYKSVTGPGWWSQQQGGSSFTGNDGEKVQVAWVPLRELASIISTCASPRPPAWSVVSVPLTTASEVSLSLASPAGTSVKSTERSTAVDWKEPMVLYPPFVSLLTESPIFLKWAAAELGLADTPLVVLSLNGWRGLPVSTSVAQVAATATHKQQSDGESSSPRKMTKRERKAARSVAARGRGAHSGHATTTTSTSTSRRGPVVGGSALPSADARESPQLIEDGLFLGSLEDALDERALKKRRITHVLYLNKATDAPWAANYVYRIIGINDMPKEDISVWLPSALSFISNARATGGRVLVHCMMGKSRSATVVAAWLMWKRQERLEPILSQMQRVRSIVNPNPGFVAQLKAAERQLVAGSFFIERHWATMERVAAQQMQMRGQDGGDAALQASSFLGELETVGGEMAWGCSWCGHELFTNHAIIRHENAGKGVCSLLIHVDESGVDWLLQEFWSGDADPVDGGPILCPGCSVVTGKWSWSGVVCECSHRVVPGFQFARPSLQVVVRSTRIGRAEN